MIYRATKQSIERKALAKLRSIFIALSAICLSIQIASAEETLVYKYSENGVPSFSDVQPRNVKYKIVQVGCYACNVGSMVNWYKTPLNKESFKENIIQHAFLNNVDPALIRAVIHAESHFDPSAISKVGAQGLMQLMPATAKELGVKNALDANDNIFGGVKHLAKLNRKYRGNIDLIAAAYNAGEGAVKKYGGIPPYAETLVYVERVKILHYRYKNEH